MRTIAILCVLLLTNTLMGQDANTLLPASFTSGPAIEEGAFRLKYEEATARLEVQKRLIADLRGVIETLKASRCPCCESGECQCAKAAKHVCVCGEGCQCDAGGTPCPCPPRGEAKAAVEQWKITFVSKDNCQACPPAKAYHEPRYRATNWLWGERSDGPGRPGMSYPYFEVCMGDSCYTVQCSPDKLDGVINELIANRNKTSVHDKRGRFMGSW